ncbi:MAG: hypothetical protein WAU88_06350 [Candidatus Zixiibacteriota bacterium]
MSDEVRKAVLQAISLYAQDSLPAETDNLRPIEDLGFDSQDGIAVACELSQLLDIEIPDEVNPLVDDEMKRGRTVEEIVTLIVSLKAIEGTESGTTKE